MNRLLEPRGGFHNAHCGVQLQIIISLQQTRVLGQLGEVT
jgi:uncharacterized protein YrrD